MKIPLAWLQLTREKVRLLIALAGIGFADMLMFMQLGFQDALFDANLKFPRNLKGDIVLLSTQTEAIFTISSFSRRSLYQSLALEEVASVSPVYLTLALWKNPVGQNKRQLMVIGFNPLKPILDLPGLELNNLSKIKLSNVVLFDEKSRAEFGPVVELLKQDNRVTTEVGQRRIRVGGLFTLGASFTADGNIITSDLNFLHLFPERESGLIDIGLIELKPGSDLEATIIRLQQKLPKNVQVLSKEEFIQQEETYLQESTAIGFIFSLGTAIGFIVGTVFVYQILYTDISDHLPEYATLKSMGYRDRYFVLIVLQEAVILAFLAYLPGYAIASGIYLLAASATNFPIMMTASRAITVLILTVFMCCLSGMIAVRKLKTVDPADIF